MNPAVSDAAEPEPAWDATRPDRRQRPTPMLSRYLLRGRRRNAPLDSETYVDRPGPWALGAFFAVVLLSVADAWFTLRVIAAGIAEEANPIMEAALNLGPTGFVLLKTLVTVLGAAFLCLHKNWRLGRTCLWIAFLGYAALTAYHLVIQTTFLEAA
jgi:hypothetical protein